MHCCPLFESGLSPKLTLTRCSSKSGPSKTPFGLPCNQITEEQLETFKELYPKGIIKSCNDFENVWPVSCTRDFIFREELGKGYDGAVYAACDNHDCCKVAKISALYVEEGGDEKNKDLLYLNEIKYLEKLKNTGWVPYLYAYWNCTAPGRWSARIRSYLQGVAIMERVDGNVDELLNNLNNEHNMTPERIKDILELIINALNFLKANKITHGDLFLRNIGYKLNTEVSSSVSGHSGRFFDLKLLDWSRAAPNNFPKHFVRNGDGDWIESTYNEDYDTWTILKELKRLGLELTPADLQNSENLAKALKPYFDNISKFNSLNAVSMCPWIKAKYNELKEHQDILELLRVSTDVETTLNQQNPFTTIGKTRFLEYIKSWGIEELYEWVSLKRQIETYSKQLKYCPHESTTFQIPLNLKFSAIHLKTKYDKYAALQWIKKNSQLCFNLSCDEKYNTKIDCNIVHNDIAFFQKVLFSSENFVYLYDDNNNVYGFGLVRASRSEPNVQNLIGMCVLPSIASTFMNSLEAWVKSHAKQDQIYLQLVISLTDNGTDFFTKRGYVFYSHNNLYRKELT